MACKQSLLLEVFYSYCLVFCLIFNKKTNHFSCRLSRDDVLVVNVFNEFQRQGLVSKYKMALQDLLMKVAGKEETLDSDIEFGTFSWAVKILSWNNFSAVIAQVLLRVVNFVAIFILLEKYHSQRQILA